MLYLPPSDGPLWGGQGRSGREMDADAWSWMPLAEGLGFVGIYGIIFQGEESAVLGGMSSDLPGWGIRPPGITEESLLWLGSLRKREMCSVYKLARTCPQFRTVGL